MLIRCVLLIFLKKKKALVFSKIIRPQAGQLLPPARDAVGKAGRPLLFSPVATLLNAASLQTGN